MRNRSQRRVPRAVLVAAAAGVGIVAIPTFGLLARTPWTGLVGLLTSEIVADALALSLMSSIAATVLSAIVGVPLAIVLARSDFPGRSLVRGLVLLPLVLPPVVGGAALLFALGRRGVIGGPLADLTGLVLPFSTAGVVLAATFVSMPFMVLTVEGSLRNLDERYEGAAASLGATPWTVLRRVTIPMVFPSLISASVLTWARALGEFGATITFAGNLPGKTQTLPLAVYVALEQDRDAAVAISLVLVAISLVVLVSLRDRWWRAL